MAIAYIVTYGDYSDYGILAAFSTREMAERFAATHNNGDSYYAKADIEEYELDCPPDNWVTYSVWLNEAGDVTYLSRSVSACSCAPIGPRFAYTYRDREEAQLAIEERVNDEQRAIKAAHEKWAAIKAAVPWGDEKALELLTRARRE